MKKSLFLFLIFSLVCFPVSFVRAEDLSLKIQALPDQSSVKIDMMFLVRVAVRNLSSDTSEEFWSNSCSYEKHWVTDQSMVLIQSWTCDENTLEQVTLDPGSAYEKSIILYIPQMDKTGPVNFRLGFKRMSENGDVAEPLWSDPVTMNVIVPEDMKDAAAGANPAEVVPSQDADAAAPESTPAEKTDASKQEPAAPAVSQPFVFQDPGVPITVGPGQKFSISLASNPSTGFRWNMILPQDQKTVVLLGSGHVVSDEVMPGVPGTEVFNFKALTRGETKAEFVYERPWETKTAPTRKIFTILVQES